MLLHTYLIPPKKMVLQYQYIHLYIFCEKFCKTLIFLTIFVIIIGMKILVVSDTHRQVNKVKEILWDNPDITNLIHLGDMVSDAEEIKSEFPNLTCHIVKGNNDWCSSEREFLVLNLCEHNIFATHGHLFGVRQGADMVAYRANSFGCDLALYGHTHIFNDQTFGTVRCLNPSNKGYFIITDTEITFNKF